MTTHLAWSTLNDFVDDRLSTEARASAAAHVLRCANCRQQLDGLRNVLAETTRLTPEVEIPADGWHKLQAAIRATHPSGAVVTWWQRPAMLAAAAVGLVVFSSGLTWFALRQTDGGGIARSAAVDATSQWESVSASWRVTEQGWLASVEELRALLHNRPGLLSSATTAMLERNLAIIDSAIAESRDALARDPANVLLAEVLAASYRHKVELLRCATQLEERS